MARDETFWYDYQMPVSQLVVVYVCGLPSYAPMPAMTIFVTRNSSMPYLLPSLPKPLCFTPPKGAATSLIAPARATQIGQSS